MAVEPKAIGDELADLRAQVEKLLNERVAPSVSRIADQAEDYARHAANEMRHRTDQLSGTVREQPLTAILIAAAVGWIIGRVTR